MYDVFEKWLDDTLGAELPQEIAAFCFNIYEDDENTWSVELVGAAGFDPEDDDWACDEVFDNRDEPFAWQEEANWEQIVRIVSEMIEKYLDSGKYADRLKSRAAVGMGFVDGDMHILYTKE